MSSAKKKHPNKSKRSRVLILYFWNCLVLLMEKLSPQESEKLSPQESEKLSPQESEMLSPQESEKLSPHADPPSIYNQAPGPLAKYNAPGTSAAGSGTLDSRMPGWVSVFPVVDLQFHHHSWTPDPGRINLLEKERIDRDVSRESPKGADGVPVKRDTPPTCRTSLWEQGRGWRFVSPLGIPVRTSS